MLDTTTAGTGAADHREGRRAPLAAELVLLAESLLLAEALLIGLGRDLATRPLDAAAPNRGRLLREGKTLLEQGAAILEQGAARRAPRAAARIGKATATLWVRRLVVWVAEMQAQPERRLLEE